MLFHLLALHLRFKPFGDPAPSPVWNAIPIKVAVHQSDVSGLAKLEVVDAAVRISLSTDDSAGA